MEPREKKQRQTIELEATSNKKKKIKKHRNSTKNKSVIGREHFDKLHRGSSSKLKLKKINQQLNLFYYRVQKPKVVIILC